METAVTMFWIQWILNGSKPEAAPGEAQGTWRLYYNRRCRGTVLFSLLLFVVLLIGSLYGAFLPEDDPDHLHWVIPALFLVATLGFALAVWESFYGYVEVGPEGVARHNFLGRRSCAWGEVASVTWRPGMEKIIIRDTIRRKLKVNLGLHGLGTLRRFLIKHVPRPQWADADEALSEQVLNWKLEKLRGELRRPEALRSHGKIDGA